ncbi:DUF2510 domain-containing protein [Microlunatus speluncae]|uniref:DUF2510 domain-containing protein n=1 Tax=Microlunatus speluncae TaxID=2594267 RepID=UPI001375B3C5|nr:DUF2510 domain-containing protein [Microlunatus speluncae]
MSTPGWYPDPSGAPGRFRYWDGRSWSQQTTDQPGGQPSDGRQRGRRRGPAVIVGLIALVVVLGLIVFFVVRQLGSGSQPITDDPVPSSTVSGWDDSSPTAAPSSPTPTPTPSPSGSSTARPLTECPLGNPRARAGHPDDGRVHGGGLSFPRVAGWQDDLQTSGVSWAYDVASQSKILEPTWLSLVAVGELRREDGFAAPKQAAESIMQCVATSSFYSYFESAKDLKSEAAKIDGHDAWWIRTDIRVNNPDIEAKGDTVDVIVVDTGNPDTFGMFLGGVTIGDQGLLAILDGTVRDLTVD